MYNNTSSASANASGKGGNPFRMPTDEEVFLLRDEERRMRQEGKGSSLRTAAASSAYVSPYPMRADPKHTASSLNGTNGASSSGLQLPAIEVRERENMITYIQKKREMGLARMSLATKRTEIKKLEEDADRAEKRLRQQQEQLQNTHSKFNDFLRQSNMEQDAAVRRADIETKAKQEKMQEVKKLNGQILLIEIEKKKNDEQMEQCAEFKAFLDRLTPPQWFKDTLANLLIEDERAAIAADLERRLLEQVNDGAEGAEGGAEEGGGEDGNGGAAGHGVDREEQLLEELKERVAEASEQITAFVEGLSDDEVRHRLDIIDAETQRVPMYFTNPQQILDIFQDTEENNLFLIQNCQDLDEQLEGVSQKYQAAQAQMQRTQQRGKTQMESIVEKIAAEQARKKLLTDRLERTQQVGAGMTQDQLKVEIEDTVQRILRETAIPGIGDVGNLDTLGMLTAIEGRLEELHHMITPENGIDFKFAASVMKERDRARRHEARTVALQKAALERELRSQLALRRSQGPTEKRVGKPVMWRSRPLDTKKKQATENANDNAYNEDDEFLM